jgi:hypothetical protein
LVLRACQRRLMDDVAGWIDRFRLASGLLRDQDGPLSGNN